MKNTKNKKVRFFIGSILITAFSLQFLVIGLGSFFIYSYFAPKKAQAELLERQNNSFAYKTDTLRNLRQLDFRSFWGKPVKIPLPNNNPDGIPGGDRDYIIIFPPKILDRNASVPLRAIYLASGKTVEPDNAQFVQNVEQYVNTVGQNNSVLVEIIKNLLQNNLRMSIKDNDSLFSNIKNFLGNNNFPFSIAKADDSTNTTGNSPLLTSDDISQLTGNLDSMDTSNPQVKQLLTLVLILIMVNQSLAKSLNSDKQACLDMGGDWVNGTCQSEQKAACEDNGGTFRKFNNQCLADKQTCGNEDLQCDNSNDNSSLPEPSWLDNSNENNNQDNSVYTCACKSGYCMSDEGTCVSKNNTKKKACENSGGTWKNFFDPVELCMQTCSATQTACANFSNNYSGGPSSGGSYSQGLMGCDCSSSESSDRFNTNASSTGKCLSKDGSCIAKETTNSDDDNDGVPNGQDRCPNSQPDGSGTVNKQAGSPYYGCTCTQIQALGGIPQQNQMRQQCPPDGCEGEFLVTYDRSSQYNQMNNNQPLCQNGIVQQQQYQQQQYPYGQYGQNGQYGMNGNCPVISRVPNETCQRMNNNNNNNNNNKSLEDLLKDLLKDKNNKDNKGGGDKGGNDKGGGGGGGDKGGGNDSNSNNKNDSNSNTNSAQASGTPATSPKGVGEFNAGQTGTAEKPYQLHVSQFKKVCGENTYILASAVPGTGKFKDDPKKAGQVSPGGTPLNNLQSALNQATNCKNGVCPADKGQIESLKGQIYNKMKDGWGKLDQTQQNNILNVINGSGDPKEKMNNALNAFNEASKNNQNKTQTPAPSNSKMANSMKDLDEANPYFKVPKCEELAQAHCCVCSCCDKSKKDCGWSIGKDCKDGKCNGPACDESCSKCSEDPAKSIALVMGNPIPAKLKQSDNKCYEIDHDKEKTASKLYENYDEVMHVGQCRYDGKGSTAGCEDTPQGKDCKIIIKGKEIESFTINGSTTKPRPEKDAQYVEFPNHQDGSVVQVSSGQKPSSTDWIQKLANEPDKAKACKCGERPSEKNPDQFPDGWIHPGQNQQNQPNQPTQPSGNTGPDYGRGGENGALDVGPSQNKLNQPPSNQVSDWAQKPSQPTTPTPSESNDPFPSEWPEPITEDGQNMRPGATNPAPNTQQPATVQPQTGQPESSNQSTTGWQQVQNTWNSFKNFIKEVWNWGTFKHSGE